MSVRKEYEMAFRLRGVLEDTFKTSFGEACKMAIALEDEVRELDQVWKDYKAVEDYIEKQAKAAGAYETTSEKIQKLRADEERLRSEIAEIEKAQKDATDSTRNFNKELSDKKKELNDVEKEIKENVPWLDKYIKQQQNAAENERKYREELEKSGYSFDTYQNNLDEITQGYENVREAQKRLAEIEKDRKYEYEYLQKNYQQLRKTAQIYRDIARVGWDTFIEPQAQFEQTMSAVEAYSGATEQELSRMEAMARQIGKETKFSSAESAEAFETMALAGWNAQESIQGIPGVINLALVSEEDIGSTASTVTDNLNAFGLEIKDATHFTDVLAATATNSNTTIYGLAESLKYCNAIAGSMKFTAEDTSLMLGLLGDNGIKGSRAGTTLRRVMSALSEDIKLVKDNGEEVIVKTADADGKMRSLDSIITDLRTHFNGMTEAERAAMKAGADLSTIAEDLGIDLLNENGLKKSEEELEEEIEACTQALKEQGKVAQAEAIAQKTGMSGLLAIMGTTDERYNDLKDSIYNCAGAAQKMADIKMDNLNGDIELVKSSWEELTLTAGEYFNEDLRQYTQNFKSKIDSTQEWIANNQDLIRTLVKVAGQLGVVTGGYIALKTGARGVNVVFKDIQKVGQTLKVSKAIKGVRDLASGTKTMGTVTKTLVSYIKSPGGALAVGGAVLALVGGVTAAIIKWQKEAEQQEIDKMFGDIALSMEECQRVARGLVDSDVIRNTAEAFKAFEDVKYAEENLTSLKEKLDKYNWMVDVGLELTPEEEREYHDTITNYVSTLQGYVNDRNYAITLSLKGTFGEDSEIYKDFTENGGATGLEKEAIAVGKRINELISKAATEELLEDEKKVLEKKLNELFELIGQIDEQRAEAKRKAELIALEKKNGNAIDYDSAVKINEEIVSYVEEAREQERQEFTEALANMIYEEGSAKTHAEKYPLDEAAQADYKAKKKAREAYQAEGSEKEEARIMSDGLTLMWASVPQEIKEDMANYKSALANYDTVLGKYLTNRGEYADEMRSAYENLIKAEQSITKADEKVLESLGIGNYITENSDLIENGWKAMLANGDLAAAEALTSILDLYSAYANNLGQIDSQYVSAFGWRYSGTKGAYTTQNQARNTFAASVQEAEDIRYGRKSIPSHAGGTNYTSDSFYAGENGRTELITGAAGKKVYTAFETSEILRNIREAEELLPYFNQMRSAASIQPKTLMAAFESPRQTVIEFTHAPVIHTQSGNTAELQAILEEDRRKTIAEFDEFLRQREQDDRRRRFS